MSGSQWPRDRKSGWPSAIQSSTAIDGKPGPDGTSGLGGIKGRPRARFSSLSAAGGSLSSGAGEVGGTALGGGGGGGGRRRSEVRGRRFARLGDQRDGSGGAGA